MGVFIPDFFFLGRGLRETLGAIGTQMGKKNPPKFPNPEIFQPESRAGIAMGNSRGSRGFFLGYLGSHSDRTIPRILGSGDFYQELGEVFPVFISSGVQQFLGIFFLGIFLAWERLKFPNPQSQEIQIFPF